VGADIITISFGLDEENDTIDSAIGDALGMLSKDGFRPLIFAAASNEGLNREGRSFPASDDRVIGVYTLDGLGNDASGLNPPFLDDCPNFATFGHGVKVKWAGEDLTKSGTSFSTPILAAITANYLDWLGHYNYKARLSDKKYRRLRRKDRIEHFLKKSALKKASNSRFWSVAPWHWLKMKPPDVGEKEPIKPEVEKRDKETEEVYISNLTVGT
jgi:hypothetical protein